LIRQRGIGRVTTREIALAAGAAEGSLFKNFGDKMGLLTELLSYELPENQARRPVAIEALVKPGRALASRWRHRVPWPATAGLLGVPVVGRRPWGVPGW
jgi:AcrR family transcriptional regulator